MCVCVCVCVCVYVFFWKHENFFFFNFEFCFMNQTLTEPWRSWFIANKAEVSQKPQVLGKFSKLRSTLRSSISL